MRLDYTIQTAFVPAEATGRASWTPMRNWVTLVLPPTHAKSSMTLRDEATQAALGRFLEEHGLAGERRLYREAVRESLTPTDVAGVYRLSANATPSEAVIDVYGQGYVVQAEHVGPGLAFAESATPDWQETMEMRTLRAGRDRPDAPLPDRVEVEVRLQDILQQGGLVYPVESVAVERAWYCTLPAGSVNVREFRKDSLG